MNTFGRKSQAPVERFVTKYEVDGSTGCWHWRGSRNTKGYGRFNYDGWLQSAHRVSYMLFVGAITDGLEVDHICHNRGCVNPDHLQLLTHQANVRRGAHATKTHCKRGHELFGPNVYVNPKHPARRNCRACIAAMTRAWEIKVGRRRTDAVYVGKYQEAA